MRGKKAGFMHKAVIQLVMAGLVFAVFLLALSGRVNSREVKQQVLERQIALLIDASTPGMSFLLSKSSVNGYIEGIEIEQGRVFVFVDGIKVSKGYPYFTRYGIELSEDEERFYIEVVENE